VGRIEAGAEKVPEERQQENCERNPIFHKRTNEQKLKRTKKLKNCQTKKHKNVLFPPKADQPLAEVFWFIGLFVSL